MKFTGRNLQRVQYAVTLAIAEVHNEIATCPDVKVYAEDIAALQESKAEFERLLVSIDEAIEKEARS